MSTLRGLTITTTRAYTIAGTYDPATDPPEMSGYTITLGSSIDTGGDDTQVFKFFNGEICVPNDTSSRWSTSGATWQDAALSSRQNPGPMNGAYKQAIYVGDMLLNLARSTVDGPGSPQFTLTRQYSTDDWVTVTTDAAVEVSAPNYVPLVTDGGGTQPGPLFHHKMIHLTDGRLGALIYGVTTEDTELMAGYPLEYNIKKFRLDAIFSAIGDRGAHWAGPVPIFNQSRGMMTRGTNPDSGFYSPAICPWEVQEGAAEGCVTRRKDGAIWVVARTGGRQAGSATVGKFPIYPTPMLLAISNDEMQSFDVPRQIPTSPLYAARHGNNPNMVTLGNGVTILTYGGPGGGWICFAAPGSDPLFEGFYQISTSDAYTDIIKTAYNKALVFYFESGSLHCREIQVDATGASASALLEVELEPYIISSGQQGRLTNWGQNISGLKIYGGAFEAGGAGTAATANRAIKTGVLTSNTTYRYEWTGMPAAVEVTVQVV
jgi:hypothetical protein